MKRSPVFAFINALLVLLLCANPVLASVSLGLRPGASPFLHRAPLHSPQRVKIIDRFEAKDGRKVALLVGNIAVIDNPKRHTRTIRRLSDLDAATHGVIVPSRAIEVAALEKPMTNAHPYADGQVLVVLRPGMRFDSDRGIVPRASLKAMRAAPGAKHAIVPSVYDYGNDTELNRTLTTLGVRSAKRLLTAIGESRLAAMHSQAANASPLLPLENTYLLQITNGTTSGAVARLRTMRSILYAGANFRIGTMRAPAVPLDRHSNDRAIAVARSGNDARAVQFAKPSLLGRNDIPTNYTVAYSGQSFLNASGVNAISAYDEIVSRYHQLPGSGEIITNVSEGDIIDGTTVLNTKAPCYLYAYYDGPTTVLQNGQRYIEMPSLPAIPAYVADQEGNISGSGPAACGQDSSLGEVGLDFSVMAALPHDAQQSNELGSGYDDLFGVAPGASYRLVVPETTASYLQDIENGPTMADLVGAIIGAVGQRPKTNVITISLGFGFDEYGFPSRFLEEDPIVQSAISYAVGQGIVVCVASGDGLRTYTNAPVGPSGGTVPIDRVTNDATNTNDDEYSTIPSRVVDTGSIAVGGTTLDDVTSAPPYQAQFATYRDQLAFPEVRWNGFGGFASGFGSRVDVSAPSDNILAEDLGGVALNGGTSAATPMAAAAAAIALQVARLTGKPLTAPAAVRSLLIATGRAVPNVPQSDVPNDVGPQINVGAMVETLLHRAGITPKPALNRVAVWQRYPVGGDFDFITGTDPTEIDLSDALADLPNQVGSAAFQPISIAPDWEGVPASAKFRLYATNAPQKTLGTGPWTRIYPRELLAAGGQPFYSSQPRSVTLTYEAYSGYQSIERATIKLTFLPNSRNLQGLGPAPIVPPVDSGPTIPVRYDISDVDPTYVKNPTLIVSYPGRMSLWGAGYPAYKTAYSVPLTQLKGTVDVPVSALAGDGIYGIAVQVNSWTQPASGFYFGGLAGVDAPVATTYAYTRVATAGAKRPAAPILTYQGDALFPAESGHAIDDSYGQKFQLSWNVSNVPGASGATLELSAAGPTIWGNDNPFNNPNGSVLDNNGADTGDTYTLALAGARGTTTINLWPLSALASQVYVLRVLPTSGGKAVGEAGDVSTVMTHGVLASDGGNIGGGFATNTTGFDGLLTSNQLDADNNVDTSVQIFDQKTNLVTSTAYAMSNYDSGGNLNIFEMNGFSLNSENDTAFFGSYSAAWDSFPGILPGIPDSLSWVRTLQNPAFSTCISTLSYSCITGSRSSPYSETFTIASTSDSCENCGGIGNDYLYQMVNGTASVVPVKWGTPNSPGGGAFGLTVGSPVPLPDPGGYDGCVALGVAGSEATALSFNGAGSSIYLQSTSLTSPSASLPTPLQINNTGTLCNMNLNNGNLAFTASQVASLDPDIALGQSQFFQTGYGGIASTPTGYVLSGGYSPVGIAGFNGQYGGWGWVTMDTIPFDLLTNANGLSILEFMNGSEELYARLGNLFNIEIPDNANYVSSGPNGLIYTLGANGYEIAPFLSGL